MHGGKYYVWFSFCMHATSYIHVVMCLASVYVRLLIIWQKMGEVDTAPVHEESWDKFRNKVSVTMVLLLPLCCCCCCCQCLECCYPVLHQYEWVARFSGTRCSQDDSNKHGGGHSEGAKGNQSWKSWLQHSVHTLLYNKLRDYQHALPCIVSWLELLLTQLTCMSVRQIG